jgi:hypothetical protein
MIPPRIVAGEELNPYRSHRPQLPKRAGNPVWYESAFGFTRMAYTSPGGSRERVALTFGAHKFNFQTADPNWETCKGDEVCSRSSRGSRPLIFR